MAFIQVSVGSFPSAWFVAGIALQITPANDDYIGLPTPTGVLRETRLREKRKAGLLTRSEPFTAEAPAGEEPS